MLSLLFDTGLSFIGRSLWGKEREILRVTRKKTKEERRRESIVNDDACVVDEQNEWGDVRSTWIGTPTSGKPLYSLTCSEHIRTHSRKKVMVKLTSQSKTRAGTIIDSPLPPHLGDMLYSTLVNH